MKTVAIIYGWAEGPWQARLFKKELKKLGYKITSNTSSADIIFAHSSGCYLVPKNNQATDIFLVGLPYWPGRSLPAGVFYKLISEVNHHRKDKSMAWWINKVLHNIWYIFSRPQASFYVGTRHKTKCLPEVSKASVTIVRPSDDTMCHPDVMSILKPAKKYKFLEIPGAHDDCWIKPKSYIQMLSNSSKIKS